MQLQRQAASRSVAGGSSSRQQQQCRPFSSGSGSRPQQQQAAALASPTRTQRARVVVARAQGDDDDGLEERLAALRRAKGATPDKEGAKAKKRTEPASSSSGSGSGSAPAASAKRMYDYSDETLHWEGGPAAGDLAFNLALGATIVALPLTIGAVARSAFVKYRFSDKRVSVQTNAPWESKQTDCAYQEVSDVRVVSRGLGAWGDMVIYLRNGDKLELRSLANFKELRDYVLQRRDALGGGPPGAGKKAGGGKAPAYTDLDMDDDAAAEAIKKSGKGFA